MEAVLESVKVSPKGDDDHPDWRHDGANERQRKAELRDDRKLDFKRRERREICQTVGTEARGLPAPALPLHFTHVL